MATFDSLTNEEKQIIREYTRMVRQTQGQMARLFNNIATINGVWTTTVQALVATLDPGERIKDQSDFAGAVQITKEDLETIEANNTALLTGHNTTARRRLMTQTAGIPNVVGSL